MIERQRMRACDAQITFCGHVHVPQLYNMAPGKPAALFTPKAPLAVPLPPTRRWLAVLGSVLGIAAAALPARRAGRLDVLDAIAEE